MASDESVRESRRVWLYVVTAVIALFLIAPILIIVPMSFTDGALLKFPPTRWSLRWYEAFLQSERWVDAARTSFYVAVGTVAIATPAGTLAAYGVITSRSRYVNLVWLAVLAPLVVPLILLAVGLYFVYSRLNINGTLFGLILAHSMHAIPFVFVTMHSAFKSFDLDQPKVAQSLGASPAWAFLSVTLPQMKLSVLAAAFLAFLASFDEVVMALFISGQEHQTLPKLMFQELRLSLDPTIAAVSSLMLGLAVLVLTLTSALPALERRRRQLPQ